MKYFLKICIFMVALQHSCHSMEINENYAHSIGEYLTQTIKEFSKIKLNLVDFPQKTGLYLPKEMKQELKKIKEHIPFIPSSDIKNLYDNLNKISNGASFIASAILKHDRKGIKAGERIALKINPSRGRFFMEILPFLQLIEIQHITPLYPKIYGFYKTDQHPGTLEVWGTKENKTDNKESFVLEMEYVDTTFEALYERGFRVPDSVIFEFYVGIWAPQYYLGTFIGDFSADNMGMQEHVDYIRCYHINDDIYVIDNPLMPVRIDIEETFISQKYQKEPYLNYINHGRALSKNTGGAFLEEIHIEHETHLHKNDPLFVIEILKKYFSHFKKDARWLEENKEKNIKHFYVLK